MPRSLALLAALVLVAGCKKKEDAPAKAPPPQPAPVEPGAPPSTKPAPPPAAAAAPIDPATFAPVDVTGIAALAKVSVKGPPGAKVTADEPPFGKDAPAGVTIAAGDFVLHLWHGTVGGERTTLPMRAEMEGGKYTETTSTPELVDYTLEANGAKTYGFVQPIEGFTELGDQLLCGPAKAVATPEALAPYRAACATVGKLK